MINQARVLSLTFLLASTSLVGVIPTYSFEASCNNEAESCYVALIDPEKSKKRCSNEVAYRTIDKGAVSGIDTQQKLTIKDETHWIELWRRHAKSNTAPKLVPNVDFEKNMVIAVFQGDKADRKDMVSIEKVRLFEDKMVVLLGHQPIGSNKNKTTLRSFHIVSLPKTNLPVIFH